MKIKSTFLFSLSILLLLSILPAIGHAASSAATAAIPMYQVAQKSKGHSDLTKGNKSSLKERLALRFFKRQMKHGQKAGKHKARSVAGGKIQVVALILCILFGFIGVHRFYLGYTGLGVLYIFTVGLFGIGWLVDTILLIIPDGLTPKGRDRYEG